MLYITGMQALNLPCQLDTTGDWHRCCMDWLNLHLKESKGSLWGDYGIEGPKTIPDNTRKYYVANHIRALLDMLFEQNFLDAQGMRTDYIGDDKYYDELFRQVMKMKDLPYWPDVDVFMEKEYLLLWLNFKTRYENNASSENAEEVEIERIDNEKFSVVSLRSFKVKNEYSECEKYLLGFIHELNRQTDAFVLRGGAALRFCYGLDREILGLEFDSASEDVVPFAERYFQNDGMPYELALPCSLSRSGWADSEEKSGIHSSTRNIPPSATCLINGIRVYNIDRLASMKMAACTDFYGVLDLYDFLYICKQYGDKVPDSLKQLWGDFMSYRGLEVLRYHIRNDKNSPIDLLKLKEDVLQFAESIGIRMSDEDF